MWVIYIWKLKYFDSMIDSSLGPLLHYIGEGSISSLGKVLIMQNISAAKLAVENTTLHLFY